MRASLTGSDDKVSAHTHEHRLSREGDFIRVYFGRRVSRDLASVPLPDPPDRLLHSQRSDHKTRYQTTNVLRKHLDGGRDGFLDGRTSIGESSAEVESDVQPAPGKIIYDPFAGTGSLLYAVAHWGAYVFGSDIDGRQMRGKSESRMAVGSSQLTASSRERGCSRYAEGCRAVRSP